MHVVVETPAYLQAAKDAGLDALGREAIVSLVAANPMVGVTLGGTGGCRKFRFARPGGGKCGGYRVVHLYAGADIPVFLLTVFGKSQKSNISASEAHMLAAIARSIVNAYSKTSRSNR